MKQLFLLFSLFSSGCLLTTGLLSKECGDGFVDAPEECDDGNTASGDGCSSLCEVELCGNNRVDFGEECDDGGFTNGDGCDAGCLQEVVQFSVADINGTNVNQARFAVFTKTIFPLDLRPQGQPADGTIDADAVVLRLIISDKDNFCDLLAADSKALENLPDLEAIQVGVTRRGPIGQSDFSSEEFLETTDNPFSTAFSSESPDSVFVGAAVVKRVGGVEQFFATDKTFFPNDGKITFQSITPDKLSAQMDVTLAIELVLGPFNFDDAGLDGVNAPTVREISEALSVSVENISVCP